MPGKRFNVDATFRAIDKVSAPVNRMQNRVGRMTRRVSGQMDRLNRRMDKFGSRAKRGALVVAVAAAAATAAMADVVRTGAKFEQSLTSAVAKFPGEIRRGSEAYGELSDAARKAGRETEFMASDAAAALNFFAMAGFDAEGAIAALPTTIDLATVAETDLATATDIATDALGAFNMESKDAVQQQKNLTRIVDVMAKTTTTANTNLEQMFDAIKDGAPVATAAGASLETVASIIGILAGAGIKGTKGGTALKNLYAALADPAKVRILEDLGVKTADAKGNMRDVVDVVDDLLGSVKDLGSQQRLAIVREIFGKIPLAAVNKLLATGAGRMREYRAELEAASGSAATMAGVIRDTVGNELKEFASAVESVKISTFTKIRDRLSEIVTNSTAWVRANEDLISTRVSEFLVDLADNYREVAENGKKIGTVVAIFVGLFAVLKLIVLVSAAAAAIVAAPWIGLVALIGLVIAAILGLLKVIHDFGFKRLLSEIGGFFATIWKGATVAFNEFLDWVLSGVDKIVDGFNKVKGFFGDKIGGVFGFLGGDDDADPDPAERDPQLVGQGERIARILEERRETSAMELLIRDQSGRAALPEGFAPPPGLKVQLTGDF